MIYSRLNWMRQLNANAQLDFSYKTARNIWLRQLLEDNDKVDQEWLRRHLLSSPSSGFFFNGLLASPLPN